MPLLESFFKIALLAAPLVVTGVGIRRTRSFWPLVFLTLIGSTITFINFRVAGQFADLAETQSGTRSLLSGHLFRLFSWLSLLTLTLGLWKIRALRKEKAIQKLLAEE